MNHEKTAIQWQPIIELSIVLFTILGTTIPLYLHTDAKIESMHVSLNQTVEAIRQDMRDFHGRLCAIEEKNRRQ